MQSINSFTKTPKKLADLQHEIYNGVILCIQGVGFKLKKNRGVSFY